MSTVFRSTRQYRTYFDNLAVREEFTFESNSPPGTFVKTGPTTFAIPTPALTTGPQIVSGFNTTSTGKVKYYDGAVIPTVRYRRVIRPNPAIVRTEADMRDW